MSTQHYQVTARKYRPKLFGELVCQEHVTETLRNAIRLDRLAHAYLFSGPRGVGKTTAARVLAKAINCTTPLDQRVDGAEPCRTCDSCRTLEEGRSLSVIEVDAASNNKVDDIRDLRDTVRIPPQGGRKKVYIVDEVHMLSASAFNAFLKTLEEPPPYALFIFATTEPHKVLPTILSRCQRFDFRRIPVAEIVAHLRTICQAEGIEADEGSLLLIARKGDGALRDALSSFDQAVSLCGMQLRYSELVAALRVVDEDLYFRLTHAIVTSDSASILHLVEEIIHGGYDLHEFLSGVAEHLRNVLVARTMPDLNLIEATEATRNRFADVAERLSETDLLRMLTIVDDAERAIRLSAQPRLKVEISLLKMAALPGAADLRDVIRKIDALENQHRPASAARVPLPQESPKSAEASPRPPNQAPTPRPSNVHELSSAASRRESDSDAPGKDRTDDAEEPDHRATRPAQKEGVVPGDPQAPSLFGPPALRPRTPTPPRTTPADPSETRAMFAGSGALAAAPEMVEIQSVPEAPGVSADVWETAVGRIQAEKIHVGALMRHCRPADLRRDRLTISVPDDFHQRMLGTQDAYLLEVLSESLSVAVSQLRFVVDERLSAESASDTSDAIDRAEYFNRKRQENPVINAIFEQFGGEIVW